MSKITYGNCHQKRIRVRDPNPSTNRSELDSRTPKRLHESRFLVSQAFMWKQINFRFILSTRECLISYTRTGTDFLSYADGSQSLERTVLRSSRPSNNQRSIVIHKMLIIIARVGLSHPPSSSSNGLLRMCCMATSSEPYRGWMTPTKLHASLSEIAIQASTRLDANPHCTVDQDSQIFKVKVLCYQGGESARFTSRGSQGKSHSSKRNNIKFQ